MESPWKNVAPKIDKYPIFESSAEALQRIENKASVGTGAINRPTTSAKYPFPLLKIGMSFAVPFADIGLNTICCSASRFAARSGKKFTVIKHTDLGVYEVARIA